MFELGVHRGTVNSLFILRYLFANHKVMIKKKLAYSRLGYFLGPECLFEGYPEFLYFNFPFEHGSFLYIRFYVLLNTFFFILKMPNLYLWSFGTSYLILNIRQVLRALAFGFPLLTIIVSKKEKFKTSEQ